MIQARNNAVEICDATTGHTVRPVAFCESPERAIEFLTAVECVEDLKKALIDMLENGDARSRQMARAALRKAGVIV